MEVPSPASWIPVGLFVLLACYFLQKAIRSRARRSWGWGRVGGPVPVSRCGYAVWGIAFLAIAGILAHERQPPVALIVLLGLCFVAIVAVGIRDTRAHRRPSTPPSKRPVR
jgi:phosphatidylglycerophosphate synthase